jgi:predicted nucleic acid-binding protein
VSHILDATVIINLINGGIFRTVIALPGYAFGCGSTVEGESSRDQIELNWAVKSRHLTILDDAVLTARDFEALVAQYGLGDGELECILFGRYHGMIICTDDSAARSAVLAEGLGLSGTLGLMKFAVAAGALTKGQAHAAYDGMRQNGAFLPNIGANYF